MGVASWFGQPRHAHAPCKPSVSAVGAAQRTEANRRDPTAVCTTCPLPPPGRCVDINNGNTENPIVSRRPDKPSAFHMVYDDLSGESRGFGYVTQTPTPTGREHVVKAGGHLVC